MFHAFLIFSIGLEHLEVGSIYQKGKKEKKCQYLNKYNPLLLYRLFLLYLFCMYKGMSFREIFQRIF